VVINGGGYGKVPFDTSGAIRFLAWQLGAKDAKIDITLLTNDWIISQVFIIDISLFIALSISYWAFLTGSIKLAKMPNGRLP
jgi:hypothetical protein